MEQGKKQVIHHEIKDMLKNNIRDYMMYIILLVIMIIFTFNTNGAFLTARNISNLMN
ncbi:MAG: hypothetical protein N4A63_06215 [Vallitalea sp.]|jgi:putative multiple sugar transport system permease protein|nr:hypothetical protein [Vallitalea sp.]